MKQFEQFQILGHTFDHQTLKAQFSYSFDNEVNFTETIDFSYKGFTPITNMNDQILNNLLNHLSIALGISYYKLYPTQSIEVKNQTLNKDQCSFWEQFYINGLGEFFFRNNLKPFTPGFISGVETQNIASNLKFRIPSSGGENLELPKALIPLGGGKDSLVSVELIKKLGIPFDTCTFGKNNPLYEQVNTIIGSKRLFISRNMDPLLFKMNTEGYYNGHVPISGIIAFALTVVSYIYDYKYIVMSNEKSANEGNTEMACSDASGDVMIINHQRSKSLDFERTFSEYVEKYISPDVKYFSLLRGMYEVKIAQEFAKYPQYFEAFSSCNANFKILGDSAGLSPQSKLWCGKCPKCAFVYTILRPYLNSEQTMKIFGKELYEDASLEQLFKELLGISGIKPFECVGTNEEMILAMYTYYQRSTTKTLESPIIKLFTSEILSKMTQTDFINLEKKLTKIYNEDNIPAEIRKILPI